MTDDPREIEAKFTVDDDGRERLLSIESVGDFRVVSRLTAKQVDLYFDSEDRALAAVGATVRVRRLADRAKMTFKGKRNRSDREDEAHIANRLEDEVPVTVEYADVANESPALPEHLGLSPLDRASTVAGGQPLLPVARLENLRTTIVLRDASEREAELAVDECVGTRLEDGRTVEFGEVELEGKGIDATSIRQLAEWLIGQVPGLMPSSVTKLERVLGDGED